MAVHQSGSAEDLNISDRETNPNNSPLRPLPNLSTTPTWKRYVNSWIAAEISAVTRYVDRLIQWQPRSTKREVLLELVDAPRKEWAEQLEALPNLTAHAEDRTAILLNGTINHDLDIEGTLRGIRSRLNRHSRVLLVAYNPYLRWLYKLANTLGVREGEVPCTFVTNTDLANIASLAGFEVTRTRPVAYCPFRFFGLGDIVNRVLPTLPLLRWLSLAAVVTLRPRVSAALTPSVTVVIPARNERGNIENALKRMPDLGAAIEVIFVEGHSNDGTWEEIERVIPLYRDRFSLKAFRQTGKGKNDAVRLGFSNASHDLLVILDADLTMPPELLPRFVEAYTRGLGDFINGNRLVYPMEGQAMKFLNNLGNIFFAKALSFVLDARLGDSLCGTKVLSRRDYQRIVAWRKDFGDFDPFGDFELLFPASILGLGIIDVPIRYRDRSYGQTNISRFRHGWMLLKMTVTGLLRIKMGRVPLSTQ